MKNFLIILAFLPLSNVFPQSYTDIEDFTRQSAMYLGAPERTVNKSIMVQDQLNYLGDDIWGNYYVKHYGMKGSAGLVDLGFESLPWYEAGKCLSKITITYVSNSSYSAFFTFMDSRSLFKKTAFGKYIYLAFDSPMIEILKSMNYSRVTYDVKEKKDYISADRSTYSLNITITLDKDNN